MDNSFELNSLSQWAACVRDRRVGAQLWSCLPSVHRDDAEAASTHGAAAVQVIRMLGMHTCQDAPLTYNPAEIQAMNSARLAFRAALAAVGLRTL